jgi:hypothetical protein
MVSCGEKETITSKNVKATGVYGDNADLISIVDDTCTLNKKDGRLRVKVQLKLEKKANNDVSVYPVLVLKDEDGVQVINGWYQMELGDSEKSKFDSFVKGNVGSVVDFVFVNEFSADYFNTALKGSETFSIDKLAIKEIVKEKDPVVSELEALNQIAKEAAKMAEDYDDEDYEKALKTAEKSLKAAEKVLEMEEDLLDMMDDLDW